MKFLFLSFRRNILPIIFVVITIYLVIFSKSNLTAAKNGLTLWATCVVPSLFPFFVITNLLSHTKVVSFTGKLLDKFMRPLFNVPGIGGFAFVMGLISGYPVGAKVVSDFRQEGLVTKDEGERMLAFTNNSGPLFIISSVGISLFGDTTTGLLLLCTHVLACITVGIILGKFSKKSDEEFRAKIIFSQRNSTHFIENSLHNKTTNRNNSVSNFSASKSQNVTFKNLGEVLGSSINNSISTILMIGGFVVIFSVIISILNQTHALDFLSKFFNPILAFLGFDLNFAKPLLSGILELTNGVNLISGVHIKAISQNVILCAFLLGFGGFSVLLQVFSIVAKTDLSMKKYFIGKFMQGIFAAIYTFLALKFIPFINLDIIQTSSTTSNSLDTLTNATNALYSYFYDLGIFVIGIIIVFAIFGIFKRIYRKI
mgnify:CR=1 FL=1